MITYPGLPGPQISDHLTREGSRSHYAEGTEFHIGRIDMVANTGTYLDTPFHRYPDGFDLADLPLEAVAEVEAVVVRLGEGRQVTADHMDGVVVTDRAVLIHTGWDRHCGTDAYFHDHPYLTEAGARRLVDNGARLVGI